jgi:peroxiredoxin Q/BCP
MAIEQGKTFAESHGSRCPRVVALKDFAGKNVILYFYPKDDTPGCTKEACGFRDDWKTLQKLGAVVLGVSADNGASHQKFTAKYKLPFPLLSDADRKVMQQYGAYGEKMMYGKKTMGVIRSTVWIGPDGKVKKHWARVARPGASRPGAEALRQAADPAPHASLRHEPAVQRVREVVDDHVAPVLLRHGLRDARRDVGGRLAADVLEVLAGDREADVGRALALLDAIGGAPPQADIDLIVEDDEPHREGVGPLVGTVGRQLEGVLVRPAGGRPVGGHGRGRHRTEQDREQHDEGPAHGCPPCMSLSHRAAGLRKAIA